MVEPEPFDEDVRSIELSSIAAIYPEIVIDPSSPFNATLKIPVVPSTPLRVCFDMEPDSDRAGILTPREPIAASERDDIHILSHLPPVKLEIALRKGYPSNDPPFLGISTNPPWLPLTKRIILKLDVFRLWEECGRDLVVYTYIDHLQQLADTAFGLNEDQGVRLPSDLKTGLLDFNYRAEKEKFEQETFECGVCLEPKKGVSCHRLSRCSHVFCIPCLQDFYNTCITEGDVDSVKCLAPDCSKQKPLHEADGKKPRKRNRTISPRELLQIPLEQDTVKRYVFLKRKKKLESDKTTIYCPRQWCQGAARSKKHPKPTDPMMVDFEISDDEEDAPGFDPLGDEGQLPPVAERLNVCEDCGYAFCSVCKKGWHGELVRCFPRRQAELSEEEKATEEYLKRYTSPCPTCSAPCQKQMGCNHMVCFKCATHFCYLCSSWLYQDNPYRHFNDINGQCYQRLWDLEGGDGIDPVGAEVLHQLPIELLQLDGHNDAPEPRRQPAPAPAPRDRPNDRQNRDAGQGAAEERQEEPARRGLQRFLDLVQNDREDEWDSDELDDF